MIEHLFAPAALFQYLTSAMPENMNQENTQVGYIVGRQYQSGYHCSYGAACLRKTNQHGILFFTSN